MFVELTLSAWGNMLRFSVPGDTEEIAGLWFAREDQHPDRHYAFSCNLIFSFFTKVTIPVITLTKKMSVISYLQIAF